MTIYYFQLGGLKREFHHILKAGSEPPVYEPTMVIYHERRKGFSFQIPQEALWKYLDPKDNVDAMRADEEDFKNMLRAIDERRINIKARMRLTPRSNAIEGDKIAVEKREIEIAIKAVTFAILAGNQGMLRCMVFNLAVCLQLFDIPISGDACAQLLMFIQDGLDELKDMKPHVEEDKGEVAGEVTLFDGTTKIGSAEIRVTETELITEHTETEGSA